MSIDIFQDKTESKRANLLTQDSSRFLSLGSVYSFHEANESIAGESYLSPSSRN